MTDEDKRATQRVPVALRIRLRYQAVDQFISKFAINISRGGMFLSSRNPKPPGTELYFEIRLADESPVIEGTGEVRWIREYDRRQPGEPHGMGIKFLELSEDSWPVLDRIIEHRRHIGEHDDHSIPDPRTTMLGLGPALPVLESSSVSPALQAAESRRRVAQDERPRAESTPAPVRREVASAMDERLRGELMRALAPPVPLSRSMDASRALAPQAGADPPVVRAAMARARTLAGGVGQDGDLDRELAQLLEETAVPVEISVEAASRELAERLGGAPVERRRAGSASTSPSAPAAPPPGRAASESAPPRAHTGRHMSLDEALMDEMDSPGQPHGAVAAVAPEGESSPVHGDSHSARLVRSKS
jgi:uncharacterized protein (TIGR02266 family)